MWADAEDTLNLYPSPPLSRDSHGNTGMNVENQILNIVTTRKERMYLHGRPSTTMTVHQE